jgi:hypothetical protein
MDSRVQSPQGIRVAAVGRAAAVTRTGQKRHSQSGVSPQAQITRHSVGAAIKPDVVIRPPSHPSNPITGADHVMLLLPQACSLPMCSLRFPSACSLPVSHGAQHTWGPVCLLPVPRHVTNDSLP